MLQLPRYVCISYAGDISECAQYAEKELLRYLGMAGIFPAPDDAERDLNNGATACANADVLQIHFCERATDVPADAFRRIVSHDGIRLEASGGRGLIYAVYDFLEALGFRFLTSDCDVIPVAPLVIRLGTVEQAPAFRARELFWRDAMYGAFAVRLRLNSARSTITPEQGGKLMFYNFSHSFDALVPVENWFESHPEYFSMRNGERQSYRTQLCLTNPDVLKLCIAGVRRWIRENPECNIFSVSMNDWYNPCECPNCRAVDEQEGSQAGCVIRFVNAIADDIASDYPDVMIHTFAYLYCRKPPKLTKPKKNVIVRLCSIECCFSHPIGDCGGERGGIDVQNGLALNFSDTQISCSDTFINDLRGWSKICDNLYIWDYTTNYSNYLLPFPNINVLQANLKLFYSFGVKGVFEQGNFSHGKCSALGQLKTYLLAKLLWNPNADVDKLIDEFVKGYYAPAAEPMLQYVRLWQTAAGESHAGIYDMPDADYQTDELLGEAENYLASALKLSFGTPVYERVEREALSVRYARLTREAPDTKGHVENVDAFMRDAKCLGITELFERKAFDASATVLKYQQYAKDRRAVPSINYPI